MKSFCTLALLSMASANAVWNNNTILNGTMAWKDCGKATGKSRGLIVRT
jgi:hypothetical protein